MDMKKIQNIPSWVAYLGAVVLFLALSLFYFAPQMEGKQLSMGDITQYEGMAHDIKEMQAEGEDPQWTGNAFGGMPAYLINIEYPSMVIKNVSTDLANWFGRPAVLIFLAICCFWVMLLLWGLNPLVAIVPAIAYGFSTYSILIIGAGHITKMFAFAYAPLLVGGVVYVLRGGRVWLGALLTALFAALQIGANHPQITYYFALVILAAWINYLIVAIREHTLKDFARRTAALVGAAILAVGANFSSLYYTAQHQGDTIRGGSPLAAESTTKGDKGLDIEYATAWSYGRTESLNMFIPNLMGGSSAGGFAHDGKVADALRPYGARQLATQLPAYWGDQPGTAGPTYLGASFVFLAVLALFLLKGREKWWLFGVSLFALLLSWGSNLMWFTELMFNYLPMYDKFRAVSTALVVLQWSVPLLGALVLWNIYRGEYKQAEIRNGILWSAGLTGGVALLMWLLGGALFTFSAPYDAHFGLPEDILYAMEQERAAMLKGDALRSLLFVVATAAALWLCNVGKIKRGVMLCALGLIVTVDMVGVDSRYLFWGDFVRPAKTEIKPTAADLEIMMDNELGYRVANFAVDTFNDATTSYFHRSVGGYHGAKLARYNDLITHSLSKGDAEVYDMLNTKYFIVPDEATGAPVVELNPEANGPAWFVEEVVVAGTPTEEMNALRNIDTRTTAVIEHKYLEQIGTPGNGDSEIWLEEYSPNYLKYRYTSEEGGLCIFSEIFYDKGWVAKVDGKEQDYLRANYVLRAMVLPAGEHTVEWSFRAPHFALIEGVTLCFSLAIILGVAIAAVATLRKAKREKQTE